GWNWCQFNFNNGEAYTCAAFQVGGISLNPLVYYGFYLKRQGDSWLAERVLGGMALDHLIASQNAVMQATSWVYTGTNLPDLSPSPPPSPPPPFNVMVTTAPWVLDGSFVTADLATPSEVPVSATLTNTALAATLSPLGEAVAGHGYCETVNWEPWPLYVARATAFLKDGAP
ncbi:MAG TPA: hypothetical protein VGG29_07535, partial [Caulobacteraceae bacterium]